METSETTFFASWCFFLLSAGLVIAFLAYVVFWITKERQRQQRNIHTPLGEKIAQVNCPKCGRPMESGFVITNQQHRLRWAKRLNIFETGERLHIPFSLWSTDYEAVRCASCGLVLFSYDPETKRERQP